MNTHKGQSQVAIYGGMLVEHRNGGVGRVINITLNPYFIPGVHTGTPDIVAYVESDGGTEYWLVEDCAPVAQIADIFDVVIVADSFGHKGYATVLDAIGADIVIRLEEDDEIYLIHSSYIVSVIPAQELAGVA